MRRFFIVAFDSLQTGVHALVPNYSVFDLYFDYFQVKRCQRVSDDALMAAQLLEKPGKRIDFVGNPLGWPIVSPAMLRVFESFAGDDIQSLRFNAVDETRVPVLSDYRVVNVLRCLDQAVDLERSVISRRKAGDEEKPTIITPVFRISAIPRYTHVFRFKESLFSLVVSQEFAETIDEAKLKGCAFVEAGGV